jgi:hypothetical protein
MVAFRHFAVFVFAFVLAGCATPRTAMEHGTARLLPDSVYVGPFVGNPRNAFIYGVIEGSGQRETISIVATDCDHGVGTIFFSGASVNLHDSNHMDNLLFSGNTPADKMFKDLCTIGLPLVEKYFAQQRR